MSQVAYQTGPSISTSFSTANNQIGVVGGIGSYTYDAVGNVISDGTYAYRYDGEGNLVGASGGTTASYVYNALNQRVKTATTAGTQQFLFQTNGQRVATLDGSGTAVENQAYWGSQPQAFYKSGTLHCQHQDWLGTERLRTTSAAWVEGSFASLPFGD